MSGADRATGTHRRALRVALRALAAVVLLALAVRTAFPDGSEGVLADLARSWVAPPSEALLWFAVAFALFGLAFMAVAARFVVLLRAEGLHGSWAAAFRAYVVANLLSLVLVTPLFGDAYRVADTRRDTGSGSEVLGLLVVERLLSLAALGCLVVLALPFVPTEQLDPRLLPCLGVFAAGYVATLVALLHPAGERLLRGAVARITPLAPRLGGVADRTLAAVARTRTRPRMLAGAFALSLLAQALPVAAVHVLSLPLGAPVAWYWTVVVVPFITLVSLIPVSIGGIGLREYLFVTLFGAVGMNPPAALSLALANFAVVLAWGLVGLLLLALGRRAGAERAPATL